MGPYGSFVISAYAIASFAFIALAIRVLISNRKLKQKLAQLEEEANS